MYHYTQISSIPIPGKNFYIRSFFGSYQGLTWLEEGDKISRVENLAVGQKKLDTGKRRARPIILLHIPNRQNYALSSDSSSFNEMLMGKQNKIRKKRLPKPLKTPEGVLSPT